MVAADSRSSFAVYLKGDLIADFDDPAFGKRTDVNVNAVGFLGVFDNYFVNPVCRFSGVSDLTAALAVEHGPVCDKRELTLGYFFDRHIVGDDADYRGIAFVLCVTDEFGLCEIPAADIRSCGSRSLALSLHKSGEFPVVDRKPGFERDLTGKVYREAEGVVKFEHLGGIKFLLALFQSLVPELRKHLQSRVDSGCELFLLDADDLFYIGEFFGEFGILGVVFPCYDLNDVGKEEPVYPEHLAVSRRAAQKSAEHVSASFVRGNDAVAHHEGGRSDMVGDDSQGNILFGILPVLHSRLFGDGEHDVAHGVDFKEVVDPLQDAGKALKSHTGVDIGLRES